MISISRIDDANASYYQDRYFFENPHVPGQFIGGGCEFLDLPYQVTQQPYERLLQGFSPDGQPLIRNAGPTTGWYGIDWTASAPKSVSIRLIELLKTRPQEAADLLVDAVRPVIDAVEQRIFGVRFGKGGIERQAAKMIVAVFPQFESRSLDPHAHAHMVIMRPACTVDGRWGALNQQDSFVPGAKLAMGALFRAELAYLCHERLGMNVVPDRFSFKDADIQEELIPEFSQRRKAIEKHLAEVGLSSAEASAYAALATREAKEHVQLPQLVAEWNGRVQELGLTIKPINMPAQQVEGSKDFIEELKATAVKVAVERITESQSTFNDFDLIQRTAEEAPRLGLSAQQVLSAVDQALAESPEIVRIGTRQNRPVYSTQTVMDLEEQIIAQADTGRGSRRHVVETAIVDQVLKDHSKLSEEQQAAVRYLTESSGSVRLLAGWPGVGKTTLLQACRDACERAGYNVQGAALSGKAAVGLTNDAGIPSKTVAATLMGLRADAVRERNGEPRRVGINEKTIFVLDESATVGTKQMAELQSAILARGGKLVICGDVRQTQSIEFGGAMAGLSKRLGRFELSEIRRQTDERERQAIKDFGLGNATEGLRPFTERKFIEVLPTRQLATEAMVRDWADLGVWAPEQNLMLTGTRAEASRANAMAQAVRKSMGQLSEESISHNDLNFHRNDRVIFLKNNTPLGIRNGQLGNITEIDPEQRTITVEIDRGPKVLIPLDAYPHVDLGMAITTHKAQGVTAPRVFALIPEYTDREMTLVQVSRHREHCKLYVDEVTAGPKLKDLAESMSHSRQKAMAHDQVNDTVRSVRPALGIHL